MSWSRRALLRIPLLAGLWPLPARLRAAADRVDVNRTLAALVETLMPASPEWPGALEFAIDRKIRLKTERRPGQRALIEAGCGGLEREARTRFGAPFHALGREQRERLVTELETAADGSPEQRFFRRVHTDLMRFYYIEPRVWQAIGFDGPPQPHGFADFTRPRRPG